MTQLFPQNLGAYLSIFFIFARIIGLFLIVPVFSHRVIPMQVKAMVALVLSFSLYPMLRGYLPVVVNSLESIAFLVLGELALGFLMGFLVYLSFEAINLAAQFIGYQMGFGTVGLLDPNNGASVSPLVPLTGIMAMVLFLLLDMHHHLIKVLMASFQITHSFKLQLIENKNVLKLFIDTSAQLFVIAIRIAAPFTLIVLASNAAVGILSRMLPQMHVLLFSFPVTILLGLLALYFLAPEVLAAVEHVMSDIWEQTLMLLRAF